MENNFTKILSMIVHVFIYLFIYWFDLIATYYKHTEVLLCVI